MGALGVAPEAAPEVAPVVEVEALLMERWEPGRGMPMTVAALIECLKRPSPMVCHFQGPLLVGNVRAR